MGPKVIREVPPSLFLCYNKPINILPMQESFSKDIIAYLELSHLPEKEQAELVVQIMELLQKRILARLPELLGDVDPQVLRPIAGDFERLIKLIKTQVPNFDEILKEEVATIQQQLKEAADATTA